MRDSEFFATNKGRRYRVRPPCSGDCPGADNQQAVLVAKVGPGAFMRHVLPGDLDTYDDNDDSLGSLAGSTAYAAGRKAKKWLSMDQVRSRFEKRLKSKARRRAMEN